MQSWNYYWLICYLFNNSSVGDEEIWSFAKSFVLADQESVDVSEPRHQEFPWCAERNEAGPEAYSSNWEPSAPVSVSITFTF